MAGATGDDGEGASNADGSAGTSACRREWNAAAMALRRDETKKSEKKNKPPKNGGD